MIKIITKKQELIEYRNKVNSKLSIGLVPTMGNLHEGHISLLKEAILNNDITFITIFVNPKQFGPNEDFNNYPRTLDADLTKIENLILLTNKASTEIIVFAPSDNKEVYPDNFSTTISIGNLKNILCGKVRPIHFDGVTTVVQKLFSIIRPTNVYFGQKDYQQCIIIKKMIYDLELEIKMHILPIVRNSYGLALSSRNQYLSKNELEEALILPTTLNLIKNQISTGKDYSTFLNSVLLNSKWEYLEVLDADTLATPKDLNGSLAIIGAYKLNTTRLLDNILVNNA